MKHGFVAFIACACLLSCGSSTESDKVGDAQTCLDQLTSTSSTSDVNTCISKVDGLSGAGAEGIRCSGGFIREGFSNGTRLISAFTSIDGGTGSSNVQSLMGLLSFTSAGDLATDYSDSNTTFTACLDSGAKGATLLASFSFFTMGLVKYFVAKSMCAGTQSTDATTGFKYYDLSGCITTASSTIPNATATLVPLLSATTADSDAQTAQTTIGAIIIASYELSCTGSGANANLCSLLSTAITAAGGTSNPRAVAVNFFSGAMGLP